jgi:hypothetical protein
MRSLPPQISKQLSTISPAEKSDEELGEVFMNVGKNEDVWQATEIFFKIIGHSTISRVSDSEMIHIY